MMDLIWRQVGKALFVNHSSLVQHDILICLTFILFTFLHRNYHDTKHDVSQEMHQTGGGKRACIQCKCHAHVHIMCTIQLTNYPYSLIPTTTCRISQTTYIWWSRWDTYIICNCSRRSRWQHGHPRRISIRIFQHLCRCTCHGRGRIP